MGTALRAPPGPAPPHRQHPVPNGVPAVGTGVSRCWRGSRGGAQHRSPSGFAPFPSRWVHGDPKCAHGARAEGALRVRSFARGRVRFGGSVGLRGEGWGPLGPFLAAPRPPSCAGPAAAPKMASGLCKLPVAGAHGGRASRRRGAACPERRAPAAGRARAPSSRAKAPSCCARAPRGRARAPSSRARGLRAEPRASGAQGARSEPPAAATRAVCVQRPCASSVQPAACSQQRVCTRGLAAAPAPLPASPFPPSAADRLQVALSAESRAGDYPSDNVLIVLLALCQANLNCVSILQHLFSAITIWINLKL